MAPAGDCSKLRDVASWIAHPPLHLWSISEQRAHGESALLLKGCRLEMTHIALSQISLAKKRHISSLTSKGQESTILPGARKRETKISLSSTNDTMFTLTF